MIALTPELQDALRNAHGGPIKLEDPQTKARYVLLREADYEPVKPLFEEDPPTKEEQLAYLAHMIKISGWDDPEMDIYDDMK